MKTMIDLTSGCVHHYRISHLIMRPPISSHDLVDIVILLTSQTVGLMNYNLQAVVTVTLDRRALIKIFPASPGAYRLSEEGKGAMCDKVKDLTSKLVKIMF